MSYTDPNDGITYRSKGEHYHVSGYVTVKVWVSFDTYNEPDESGYDADLMDAVADGEIEEIEDDSGLEFEIEDDECD